MDGVSIPVFTEPRELTRPWRPEEMAIINGVACVYTQATPKSDLLFRLPGGNVGTAEGLRAVGFDVSNPKRVRFNPARGGLVYAG
jgi:hypothetical protein